MQAEFSSEYEVYKDKLAHFVENFSKEGKKYGDQERNTLKLFDLDGETINIKSFKVPHLINKVAYRYFRKSKAQRSFEHAVRLLELDIKTPKPIAYFQQGKGLLFGESFYISHHLKYDLTYRELIHDPNFPNRYEILKQFTRFTYKLHENGVEHLDHSPGNTLIIVNSEEDYDFYIVDLNRMKFHDHLTYQMRMENFARLTPDKNMVSAMSAEYAKLIGKDFGQVFEDMWGETQKFRRKFSKKKRLKQKMGLKRK